MITRDKPIYGSVLLNVYDPHTGSYLNLIRRDLRREFRRRVSAFRYNHDNTEKIRQTISTWHEGTLSLVYTQCPKLSFYFVHSQCALSLKLTRESPTYTHTFPKTVHPEIAPCTLPIYRNDKLLKKRAHTGCTPPKIVHPAMEMYTPGAGCTLNFGH